MAAGIYETACNRRLSERRGLALSNRFGEKSSEDLFGSKAEGVCFFCVKKGNLGLDKSFLQIEEIVKLEKIVR